MTSHTTQQHQHPVSNQPHHLGAAPRGKGADLAARGLALSMFKILYPRGPTTSSRQRPPDPDVEVDAAHNNYCSTSQEPTRDRTLKKGEIGQGVGELEAWPR
eukprot:scaffold24109_cov33-Tisochrysis_lutea.AAC.2